MLALFSYFLVVIGALITAFGFFTYYREDKEDQPKIIYIGLGMILIGVLLTTLIVLSF